MKLNKNKKEEQKKCNQLQDRAKTVLNKNFINIYVQKLFKEKKIIKLLVWFLDS